MVWTNLSAWFGDTYTRVRNVYFEGTILVMISRWASVSCSFLGTRCVLVLVFEWVVHDRWYSRSRIRWYSRINISPRNTTFHQTRLRSYSVGALSTILVIVAQCSLGVDGTAGIRLHRRRRSCLCIECVGSANLSHGRIAQAL